MLIMKLTDEGQQERVLDCSDSISRNYAIILAKALLGSIHQSTVLAANISVGIEVA